MLAPSTHTPEEITYVSSMSFAGSLCSIYALVDAKGRGLADYQQIIVANLSSMPNVRRQGGDGGAPVGTSAASPLSACTGRGLPGWLTLHCLAGSLQVVHPLSPGQC